MCYKLIGTYNIMVSTQFITFIKTRQSISCQLFPFKPEEELAYNSI